MAVGRSLLGSYSRDAASDLKTPTNIVCLSDDDLICDDSPDDVVHPEPTDNQTLGQLMTQAREHRALSREQVADETHIPSYYVRMIESDSYDAIPDQLYLLPFFERYAIFLGLDAAKVVARFIRDFELAESGVLVASVPRTSGATLLLAKARLMWRPIALAALIFGILLPCIAWAIGIMRTTIPRPAPQSSRVAIPHPATAATAQQPASIPSTTVASHATSSADAAPAMQQPAPAKHTRRRARNHRANRFARHPTHTT